MTSITYDDVRSVLDADASAVSDSDLDPEKSIAEGIVTDDLEPHSDNTAALEDVAALLAAAFYRSEGTINQLSQGSQQVSYKDGSMGYWRMAQMRDPTGRLQSLEASNTARYTGTVDL